MWSSCLTGWPPYACLLAGVIHKVFMRLHSPNACKQSPIRHVLFWENLGRIAPQEPVKSTPSDSKCWAPPRPPWSPAVGLQVLRDLPSTLLTTGARPTGSGTLTQGCPSATGLVVSGSARRHNSQSAFQISGSGWFSQDVSSGCKGVFGVGQGRRHQARNPGSKTIAVCVCTPVYLTLGVCGRERQK